MGHLPRIILLVVLVILSLGTAFYTWRTHEALEGFSEEEAYSVLADEGSHYQMRIYVMKIFDALLKRKPSPDELDTYSTMTSETAVLNSVLEQYHLNSNVPEIVITPNNVKIVHDSLSGDISTDVAPSLSTFPGITTTSTSDESEHMTKTSSNTSPSPMQSDRMGMMCVDKKKVLYDLKQITDRVNAFHDQFIQM